MSKLESLEAGQSRIEESLTRRLDAHNLIFQQHTEEDKKLAEHIMSVDKEVTFAKGVTYAVNAVSAGIAGFVGWNK
jgi:hypothetical protein